MANRAKITFDLVSLTPEVTGSCLKLKYNIPNEKPIQILLDKGYYQEAKYSSLNIQKDVDFSDIDYVFLSHNHIDHSGLLPILYKNGYKHKVYCTYQTSKVLPIALNNTVQIMETESKLFKVKPLYSFDDVTKMMSHIVRVNYNEVIRINKNLSVMFIQNSHLYGAASIYISVKAPNQETNNLLYVSDYAEKSPIFKSLKFPSWLYDRKINIIQESTYGDMDTNEMHKCFKENILKCISEGGTVVTPVFSLGRSQEILYELKCMQDKGELSKDIPIYFDGKLAIRYTDLYVKDGLDVKEDMRYFFPKNLTFVDKLNRCKVLEDKERKIILTTSGMGSYGPAQMYIPEYITRKNAMIHFTGYTAEGTLGNRLKNTEVGDIVEVGGLLAKKKATVEYTTEYSAHAKADEMIEFLNQFKNLRLVLVNHGETEVKNAFAKRIVKEVETKKVGLLGREYFFRVNPYGLVKTLSTKFD